MTELDYQIANLRNLIKQNEDRISYLLGDEDLGCDGTLEELQACKGWLSTYKQELKELENESRREGDDPGSPGA